MMQLMQWLGRRCTLQAALTSSPTGRQRWGSLLASFHVSGPSVVPVLLFYLHQASNCVQVPCWTFGTLTVKGCMWWGHSAAVEWATRIYRCPLKSHVCRRSRAESAVQPIGFQLATTCPAGP